MISNDQFCEELSAELNNKLSGQLNGTVITTLSENFPDGKNVGHGYLILFTQYDVACLEKPLKMWTVISSDLLPDNIIVTSNLFINGFNYYTHPDIISGSADSLYWDESKQELVPELLKSVVV